MLGRKGLACSFCGKTAREVAKLVAGRKAYICDACIAVASEIVRSSHPGPPAPADRRSLLSAIGERLRGWIGRGVSGRVPASPRGL